MFPVDTAGGFDPLPTRFSSGALRQPHLDFHGQRESAPLEHRALYILEMLAIAKCEDVTILHDRTLTIETVMRTRAGVSVNDPVVAG